MNPKLQVGIIAVVVNIIILAVCFKVIDLINEKVIKKIKSQEINSPLLRFVPILMKVIKVILVFIAITGILQTQGYSVSSIIAGFGIGGLAVGMAAKETIANVFGSISILTDHAYKVGDYVKVNGVEGYVEDINLRSTKIRDLDNFLTSIPNNVAANSVIVNVSRAKRRLIKASFGVTYSTSDEKLQLAQDILKNVAADHGEILNDFTIAIHDLGDSSINIRFMGYVKSGSYFNFLKVRGEFIQEVVKRYRAAGIDFAFPSRSVYIEKQ